MSNIEESHLSASLRIDKIEITTDKLTSRAGLTPFVRYLDSINVFPTFGILFRSIRKNRKSQPLASIFKQIICFLADRTSSHMSYFDDLKADEGYAAGIEVAPEQMLSSHSVKRFFRKLVPFHYFVLSLVAHPLDFNNTCNASVSEGFRKSCSDVSRSLVSAFSAEASITQISMSMPAV